MSLSRAIALSQHAATPGARSRVQPAHRFCTDKPPTACPFLAGVGASRIGGKMHELAHWPVQSTLYVVHVDV